MKNKQQQHEPAHHQRSQPTLNGITLLSAIFFVLPWQRKKNCNRDGRAGRERGEVGHLQQIALGFKQIKPRPIERAKNLTQKNRFYLAEK